MSTSLQDAILADLTPAQHNAVVHIEGPLLILAGAGSGKTRVITRRVAYLLTQGVRAYQILAITFTNKAAGEMRHRIESIVPRCGVWISTFHSFGVRLLRLHADQFGLDRNFTIYDQDDRTKIVKAALESCGLENNRFRPESLEAAISKAKNQLLTPDKFEKQARDFFSQTVAQVYYAYEKRMREANALDFDDLLLWPALGLKNNEELRSNLDNRYRFVLIDEYQDTNKAQYEIAHGLSVDHPNLCVVGDPDQSIYRWRGADIRNILDFEEDYPGAKVIALEQNFRSTKTILHAASTLIAHNRKRKEKTLYTENTQGIAVNVLCFETGLEEAENVVKRIREAADSGKRRYRDFAIFMRINALSRSLETYFIRERVPFQIVRGLAFFERKENKDILAYLRLLMNPRDDLSFLRIVNEPARGIGKTSLEHLRAYAEPRQMSLLAAAAEVERIPAIKGKAAAGLKNFITVINNLRQNLEEPADELIRRVLDQTGYRKMLKDSDDPADVERLANIEELITAAHQFLVEDSSRTLGDFLENITLASDVDGWDDKQDCVSVMTLHAAKGLEFPVVYMLAVEQGLLPHERSLSQDEDIEEERRLAFVGMTRAQEELYLTHCRLREFRGQTLYAVPSMFVGELPEEGVETHDLSAAGAGRPPASDVWRNEITTAARDWYDAGFAPKKKEPAATAVAERQAYAVGMLVDHEKYGKGRVTEISGSGEKSKVKIRFHVAGERTFIAHLAKLVIVQE